MPNIDVNVKAEDQKNALIHAAEKGFTEIVEKLLNLPYIDINSKDFEGCTALIRASQNNRKAIVEMLLKKNQILILMQKQMT